MQEEKIQLDDLYKAMGELYFQLWMTRSKYASSVQLNKQLEVLRNNQVIQGKEDKVE